jgi:hypothetical protein
MTEVFGDNSSSYVAPVQCQISATRAESIPVPIESTTLVTWRSSMPTNPVELIVRAENPSHVSAIGPWGERSPKLTTNVPAVEWLAQDVFCGVD